MAGKVTETAVVGGVDTHKDLHVAAVVDQNNKVLGTQFFSTTRQGYRQMLAWMTSFGALKRIGVECTGTYGSGLLRYLQNAGLDVLEVTAPDRMERRKRGKSDTIDAECAAHAAFSGIRTVTPKTRNGMIESLRVLKTCRKTAISARRVALQIIHSNIISAPDELREQLRNMTRMQLIRTLGSWRPDASEYRNVTNVYRAANSALHIIAIGRLRTDDKTKEYVARRVAEGHTKMEAIRCLKRYISREVYTLLRNQNRQINSIPITA